MKNLPVLLLVITVFSACARQLYTGPELPAEETAHIYLSSDYNGPGTGVSLSSMVVDGQELNMFDAGGKVLPGNHDVSFKYQYAGDCLFEVEDNPFCFSGSHNGSCSLSFPVSAGQSYRIKVHGNAGGATAVVIEEDGHRVVRYHQCRKGL